MRVWEGTGIAALPGPEADTGELRRIVATVPADFEASSDADLITAVRKGSPSAYGSLYQRHVGAAHNLARQLSGSPAEADDLVSEAFAKVLQTLRSGRGPESAFRAYLLTVLRHAAYDKARRDRKVELSDDLERVGGAEPFADPALEGLERSLAAQAFARLPERWQAVLWHTEVEGQSAAAVAPLLGLTPNGVAALAYRAREGLRRAYLQVHLAETADSRCRATAERLGAWTRAGLARRERAQVEAHLDECARCRALAAELADVNGAMRGFVAPLVLGLGTVGYLAATGGAQGGVAAAAGAATAAGAAASGAAGSTAGTGAGAAGSGTAGSGTAGSGAGPGAASGSAGGSAGGAAGTGSSATGTSGTTSGTGTGSTSGTAGSSSSTSGTGTGSSSGTAGTSSSATGAGGGPGSGTAGSGSGATGGGGSAGAAAPRQLVGAAASAVALVAAIALALSVGGGGQEIPSAEPAIEQPSGVEQEPSELPPAPPVDSTPPTSAPGRSDAPGATSVVPPATVEEDGATPLSATGTPAPQQPPAPLPAALSASTPEPIALVAAGSPAELPITVRNFGGSASEPVVSALTLPGGVTAAPVAANRFAGGPRLRLDGAGRQGGSRSVGCPGGVGTVTCSSAPGLAPGESVTLLFRVMAARSAISGDIAARITAGSAITLQLRVPVQIAPPLEDQIRLTAIPQLLGLLTPLLGEPALLIHVENTGTSSGPVTVTVDQPGLLRESKKPVVCAAGPQTACTTRTELPPGESLELLIGLGTDRRGLGIGCLRDQPARVVQVSATLGTARASTSVEFDSWFCPDPPSESPPPPSETEPEPSPPDQQAPPSSKPVEPPEQPPSAPPKPTHEPDRPPTGEDHPPDTTSTPPPPPKPDHGEHGEHGEHGDDHHQREQRRGGLGDLLGWLVGGGRR